MIFIVPEMETGEAQWPTLGPQVVEFIESRLVHGPGDIRGQPITLPDLYRGLIARMYEVYPQHHPRAGRRRFKKVVLVLRKGTAKTEIAAFIAIVEAHPEAPVRTIGWDSKGQPIGGPVTDPFIPMFAITEEQSEDLAFGAVYSILTDENCGAVADFDAGKEQISRVDGTGTIKAYAGSPSARDGARTTFQHRDEPHHMKLPRHREAARTTNANILKRFAADAWTLETTTMFQPGENSVAELSHQEAQKVARGEVDQPDLFYFWLAADPDCDLDDRTGFEEALVSCSGPAIAWTDVDSLWSDWQRADDRSWFRRVWFNLHESPENKWVNAAAWDTNARPGQFVPAGEKICVGFDGSKTKDSTWLVACRLSDGFTWPVARWMPAETGVEVPILEVAAQVAGLHQMFDVVRMYCDPYWWENSVAQWQGEWPDVVSAWATNRLRPMAFSLKATGTEISSGSWQHDGHPVLRHQMLAAMKSETTVILDHETNERGYILSKPSDGALIDGAMATALAHEARRDAIADGALIPDDTADEEDFAFIVG